MVVNGCSPFSVAILSFVSEASCEILVLSYIGENILYNQQWHCQI